MHRWAPCKRRIFIKKLAKLGFSMPEPGGRHFYMRHGNYTLTIPNNPEYSVPQLKRMVHEIEKIIGRTITIEEWEEL